MIRLGVNLMAWSGSIGPAELALLPRIKAWGYDGVELPIFSPETLDARVTRRALEDAGLACTVSTALPRGASLLDAAECPAGVAYLARVAQAAVECGASILCGPLYAPVGALPGRPRSRAEWDSCVAGLRAAGGQAAGNGVTLAVEVLNRFETHFVNTAADGLALIDAVDLPNVTLHLDTFHMNVEEKHIPGALRQARRRLGHIHASENDRGSVGSGHVDWLGIRDALIEGQYDGWVVAETFTATVPEIAAATAIWRPLVPDGDTYARESIAFLRKLFAG